MYSKPGKLYPTTLTAFSGMKIIRGMTKKGNNKLTTLPRMNVINILGCVFFIRYCYCGESGDWYKKMLQCDRCKQWFHQECIRSNALPALLLGDRFFEFVCTLCTGSDEETVRRKDLSWVDALHLALFNLTVTNNNKYHDVATSLIPFVKRRWKDLASGSSR